MSYQDGEEATAEPWPWDAGEGGEAGGPFGGEFAKAAATAWRTYHPGGDECATEVLTAEQERALARRVVHGDPEARRQLISANYRLVFHVVSKFRHTGVPLEDLIQEGNVGLIEAVDRFDAQRGCRFNTYALLWIRGAVLRAANRLRGVVPIPERMAQAAARLRREEEVLAQELLRQPTADEVGGRLGLASERVEEARHLLRPLSSLDSAESDDGRTSEAWTVPSPDPGADERLVLADLQAALEEGMLRLTPRERDVLRLRYGLDTDEPRSLAEVGRALSISRQRARELEQSALRRLRGNPTAGMLAAAGD
ncbi:MAG: RNA polymerase sigma factor RpoD/SigA [Armatimonadetes bacterium]|nr:RNA polymerase sigma factor RpoD/SigA [Armatimonadota bacterium]